MRALIVDDSRSVRKIVRNLLEQSGVASADIFEAGDGVQALDVVRNHGPFDLATVDWNMPEMNGLDFVLAVRSNEAQDGMKIIMITTEDERNHVLRAVQAGAQDYVIKPFNRETLDKKLRALGLDADEADADDAGASEASETAAEEEASENAEVCEAPATEAAPDGDAKSEAPADEEVSENVA